MSTQDGEIKIHSKKIGKLMFTYKKLPGAFVGRVNQDVIRTIYFSINVLNKKGNKALEITVHRFSFIVSKTH